MAKEIAVLANDTDEDQDTLRVHSVGSPSNGTAAVQSDGRIMYTPTAGFHGTDTFTYTVSDRAVVDAAALTDTATVTVAVTPGPRTLTVVVEGSGTVTGLGGSTEVIDCGSDGGPGCTTTLAHDTTVALTAAEGANHRFAGWTGCTSTTKICSVTVTADKTVRATFDPACPAGCTSASCGGVAVCQCNGSLCPTGWARQGNCSTTRAQTCSGDTDGCGQDNYPSSCTTGFHSTLAHTARESCYYEHRDRDFFIC